MTCLQAVHELRDPLFFLMVQHCHPGIFQIVVDSIRCPINLSLLTPLSKFARLARVFLFPWPWSPIHEACAVSCCLPLVGPGPLGFTTIE